MSEATEELERRAIELYTDLNEVVKATPAGHRQGVSGRPTAALGQWLRHLRLWRGRLEEKLVTGRSNGDAYATVYATARTTK